MNGFAIELLRDSNLRVETLQSTLDRKLLIT